MMETDYIIRLFVAVMLGGVIGLEREFRAKEAGARTHILVALGSCLFMIVSQFGFAGILEYNNVSLDPSRIASQVVTGIGFIGAGTIIFQKRVVRGLTTAAGLWVTSAIGLTCGSGMYVLAFASAVLVLLCLEVLYFMLRRIGSRGISVIFKTKEKQLIYDVLDRMREEKVDIDNYNMKQSCTESGIVYIISMDMKVKRLHYEDSILRFMKEFDGVEIESID
ncbi:MgtC/SapB family protein [Prevotella sp. PMUR]|uniref:MgtC/SapB family protein n=2 Tax=Xylanibacter muris TaxID=2736290 RepID=A0ABX2AJX6_9BACT|nr:MgtC/SapB family protein [Xylanibacter muris]